MEIVIQGLRVNTCCRYIKFTRSRYLNVYEDGSISTFVIEFPHGLKSDFIIDDRIEILNPTVLQETDYIRIKNPIINLNGFEFTKLVPNKYIFRQFIVDNIDEFIMRFDESYCEILIPKILSYRTDKYSCLIGKNPYLKVINTKGLKDLRNFNSILIEDKDINLTSTNKFEFNTKSKYTKYLLSFIDVQESFISKLSNLLLDYGLELIGLPIDKNTHNVHRVTYRFTELGNQVNYKSDPDPLRFASQHRAHIEFKISTPDILLIQDFKNKYQNLDLISNFTEFYTLDKLGRTWISSVFWSPIDNSFNQDYNQDEQSNIAFEAGFSADIDYFIVFDQTYYNVQSTILSILDQSNNTISSNIIKV